MDDTKQTMLTLFGRYAKVGVQSAALLGAVSSSLYVLAYLACGDCISPLAIANNVDYLILTGGLLTLPFLLLWRPRWLVVVLLPTILAFGWWYGGSFLPHNTPQPQGTPIRVATYNVYDNFADAQQTFDVMMSLNADIVGLQEINSTMRGLILRFADEAYPYRVFQPPTGLGIISRYPILDAYGSLPNTAEDPNYIRAEIDVDGQVVVVYVYHATIPAFNVATLSYDDSINIAEARTLGGLVETETLPTIVLCDCNTTPRSKSYAVLDTVLDDAYLPVGWAFGTTRNWFGQTYSLFPLIRIDYVWHSQHFVPLSAIVGDDPGTSDHLPVTAELDLR